MSKSGAKKTDEANDCNNSATIKIRYKYFLKFTHPTKHPENLTIHFN